MHETYFQYSGSMLHAWTGVGILDRGEFGILSIQKRLPAAVALTQLTKELLVPDLGQETFKGVFRHISNTSLSTVGLFKQPHMLCDGAVLDYFAV